MVGPPNGSDSVNPADALAPITTMRSQAEAGGDKAVVAGPDAGGLVSAASAERASMSTVITALRLSASTRVGCDLRFTSSFQKNEPATGVPITGP